MVLFWRCHVLYSAFISATLKQYRDRTRKNKTLQNCMIEQPEFRALKPNIHKTIQTY